jgi:uncharacterized oxidoreductase
MPRFDHLQLKQLVARMFASVGCNAEESEQIGHFLVEANLAGHDSHGVIRAPIYIDWVERELLRPNQRLSVEFQLGGLAIVDGNCGFGQAIGAQAMDLGVQLAREHGTSIIGLRNSGHLGRIGDWPTRVAEAGMASFHFVNTSGFGLLVAPFGGIERRLSANPLAAGFPRPKAPPLILDISTSAIAEGKIKVARNQGKSLPENCILDGYGQPSTSPIDFYADPPGVLLPFGGHKGYCLSVFAELFAGALTGNGCTNPVNNRPVNGMFSIIMDITQWPNPDDIFAEVERFVDYVKSSRRTAGCDEILVPGEMEQRTRRDRLAAGIELDEATWAAITTTCRRLLVELNGQ